MNRNLERLQAYPFERLAALKRGLQPPSGPRHISLSIGEPRHPPPALAHETLLANLDGLSMYPPTRGSDALCEAVCGWVARRFGATLHPDQVLPVNGTREALFAFAQCIIDPTYGDDRTAARVLMPNPFYQIYEGAALLAGAEPVYLPCRSDNLLPDLDAVSEADWQRCRLIYVCSPGNPTGAVWPAVLWRQLLAKADRYNFVIASDECYSEIYFDDGEPPPGLLQVCAETGRDDFRGCVVFNSLSKRSSLPGLRSGFAAGDAALIKAFLRYRTYHGGAMSLTVQAVSAALWSDEHHVQENRALYRTKLDAVWPLLASVLELPRPQAGFFLWPRVPGGDDPAFAAALFERHNVTVLPGSYLARSIGSDNPGAGRLRLALVAPPDDCVEAAERLQHFVTA